jgi:Fe-S cluster biosynthesis and repair protein YggX
VDAAKRIEQFKQLCEQDPGNDMARFSLGGAYAQNGQHAEAAEAYLACVGINANFSKAYQLAGKSLIDAGETERAGEVLEKGYLVAAKNGDLMPKNGMGDLLREIGRDLPEVPAEEKPAAEGGGGDGFVCQRTKRPGTRMARAPFRGGLGAWILENISQETFNEWIGLGTKIINELRLDLSREQDDAVYDYGMRRYLGLTDEKYEELTGAAPADASGEYIEVIDTILARSGQLEDFGGELHKQV